MGMPLNVGSNQDARLVFLASARLTVITTGTAGQCGSGREWQADLTPLTASGYQASAEQARWLATSIDQGGVLHVAVLEVYRVYTRRLSASSLEEEEEEEESEGRRLNSNDLYLRQISSWDRNGYGAFSNDMGDEANQQLHSNAMSQGNLRVDSVSSSLQPGPVGGGLLGSRRRHRRRQNTAAPTPPPTPSWVPPPSPPFVPVAPSPPYESMPGNMGAANQMGSVNAGGSFNSLAELLPTLPASWAAGGVHGGYLVLATTVGLAVAASLALGRRQRWLRAGDQPTAEYQEELLSTADAAGPLRASGEDSE